MKNNMKKLIPFIGGFLLTFVLATPVLAQSNFDIFLKWLGAETVEEVPEDEIILGRANHIYQQDIYPEVDGGNSLGTSTLQWNAEFNNIVIDGTCTGAGCGGGGGGATFGQSWEVNASSYLTPTTSIDIAPFSNNTENLGAYNYAFADIFASGTSRLTDLSIVGNSTSTGNTIVKGGKNLDSYLEMTNGSFLENFNGQVQSDGTTVSSTLERTGGGDLTKRFSSGDSVLDCSPTKCVIQLTVGTDSSPQSNYTYVLESTGALTNSTTSWPSVEHIKVMYTFVPSATSVQSTGAYAIQNWNDAAKNGNSTGHLLHITQWIREQGATWFSGTAGEGSDGYVDLVAGDTEAYIKVGAGLISQVHQQTFNAVDTSQAGDDIHIVNHPITAYMEISDLLDVLVDSNNVSLSGRYYNIVIGGIANKTGTHSPIMMNLPSGSYGNSSDALSDVSGYDNYAMPREFGKESSTGFYLARVTLKHSVGGGGTLAVIGESDLRGIKQIQTVSGSGAGGTVTEFSDNTFTVFNNLDPTKILAFSASGITTGNTRTLTVPDASGEICLVDATQTLSNKTFSSSILASTNNTIDIGAWGGAYQNIFASSTAYLDFVSSTLIDATRIGVGKPTTNNGIDILNTSGNQGLRVQNPASSDIAFSTYVTGDSQVRFTFLGDGKLQWGNGSVFADTNLYRNGVSELKTDDLFIAPNVSSTMLSAYSNAWFGATATSTFSSDGSLTIDGASIPREYTTGFTYNTSTAWTGTTTMYIAPAVDSLTFTKAYCETDTGTTNVSLYDGTNRANLLNASTTIGIFNFSTNNTWTEAESIRVDIGTPVSTPTWTACRFKYTYQL